MRLIFISAMLMLAACAPYHTADPARPPVQSAYAANVSCEFADPAYVASGAGSFGLVGEFANAANHEAAGYTQKQFVDACMASKGFAPDF